MGGRSRWEGETEGRAREIRERYRWEGERNGKARQIGDSLGAVCRALKPRSLVTRKTVPNTHTKGVLGVKIIYCELNKTIEHTGKLVNNGLLYK